MVATMVDRDLKALVEAAHEHGIQVFLDVVYNHFGPQGNCLLEYAPEILTDRYETAWGQALNFDGDCCGRDAIVGDAQRALLDRRVPDGWAAV